MVICVSTDTVGYQSLSVESCHDDDNENEEEAEKNMNSTSSVISDMQRVNDQLNEQPKEALNSLNMTSNNMIGDLQVISTPLDTNTAAS